MMSTAPINGTILFVDDEPNVTAALKRALRSEPYEFLTAVSADDARRILALCPVDVVVSDEQMPGMPGSAFLSEVRVRYPSTIRIILSGHASLDAAVRAINEGEVYRFLLKPCNPTDLMVTIRQALDHKRLQEQSRRLLREYQRQAAVIAELERLTPGVTDLETDEHGSILVDEADGECSLTDILTEIEQELVKSRPRRGSLRKGSSGFLDIFPPATL
jgi:two-component system probable response regulator PhcQ